MFSDEYLLKIAGRLARFGGWSVDLATNLVTWSDEVASIHEMPQGYSPMVSEGISFYAPEWRERITKVYTDCITVGIPYDEIMQIITGKGNRVWVRTIGEPVRDSGGKIIGAQGAFQDITHTKLRELITQSKLHLINYSLEHTLDELLEEILEEAERLTGSRISFIHFVDDDQNFLQLQNWSRRTKAEFCTAEGKGSHYPISDAGVWVDCITHGRPVIHNDYASLPHRKGMPEGHAKVIRELVVPIFRGVKIKAILGVGNKSSDYDNQDIETVTIMANLAWEVAERKNAEEALKSSEDRFHRIFDISPIGMAILDQKANFIHVNPSLSHFLDRTEEELQTMSFPAVTHPDHIEGDLAGVKQLISGQLPFYQTEKRYLRPSGEAVWGAAFITVLKDQHGVFKHFLAMVKDITDRKNKENQIMRMNAELQESNATKDKFFSIIAHDLRSPFNSILGFSEMLRDDAADLDIKSIQQYAGFIHNTSRHTFNLLENLLQWARLQRGAITFEPAQILLKQVIDSEISHLRHNLNYKQISLSIMIPDKLVITADGNMIRTIMRNLVSNAVKFTPKNGDITVDAILRNGHVEISVNDTGIGMTKEQIDKLFRIETNISTRGTENEKGTGLGLVLCNDFISRQGGRIEVTSEPGKGSSFTIFLPV